MSTFFVSLAACSPGKRSAAGETRLFSRFLRTLTTQLFRIGNQRTVNLDPLAIFQGIG